MRLKQKVLDLHWPPAPRPTPPDNAFPFFPPEPPPRPSAERARATFAAEDWLGLEALEPLKVERIYGVASGPELPEVVGFKRELMRWVDEVPLAEIRIACVPRPWNDLEGAYRYVPEWETEPERGRWPFTPCCADRQLVRHAKRTVSVQDRRIHNVPVFLDIARQRFRCKACGKYCAEDLPDVHEQHRITRRLHRDIAMGSVVRPFADVAALQSVSVDLVEEVFHRYQRIMLEGYTTNLSEVIGIDEVKIRGTVAFVVSDMSNGRIVNMIAGNDKKAIRKAFSTHFWHDNVQVICQDMSITYRQVMRELFPRAHIVVDRFHVVQLVTEAMDAARVAQGADLPREDRTRLSRLGRLFNRNVHTLKPEQRELLGRERAFFPRLALAHELKEGFAHIYTRRDRASAEAAYDAWLAKLNAPEFAAVAPHFRGIERMMDTWHIEVLNWFDAPQLPGFKRRISNAYVEGLNRSVRAINRDAHGLSFETLRAKAILRFGHFQRPYELAAFRFPIWFTNDEIEAYELHPLWTGFELADLTASLKAGTF